LQGGIFGTLVGASTATLTNYNVRFGKGYIFEASDVLNCADC